jgi:hypothetical protein
MGPVCRVKLSAKSVRVFGAGLARTLPRSDLTAVVVETHVTGERVTDVWWLLYGRRGGAAVRVPQGAAGEAEMVDWLMSLPHFDIDALASAMRFRGNATFEVWKAAG